MDVTTERQDGVVSAQVGGRIDGSNAAEFEEAIRTAIEESDRAVILDFEKLVYISSAGLRAILLTAKSLGNRNAKLAPIIHDGHRISAGRAVATGLTAVFETDCRRGWRLLFGARPAAPAAWFRALGR